MRIWIWNRAENFIIFYFSSNFLKPLFSADGCGAYARPSAKIFFVFACFNSSWSRSMRIRICNRAENFIFFYQTPQNSISCRWVRGICEAIRPLETLEVDGLVRLWAHEALRLFQDRLGRTHHILFMTKNALFFEHFLGLPLCSFHIWFQRQSLRLSKKKIVGICVHFIYASKNFFFKFVKY